jgi:hypothetical protein
MALVEPVATRRRYAFEPAESTEQLDLYRDLDTWNFEDSAMRPSHLPPPLPTTKVSTSRPIDPVLETTAITKDLWTILNVLEKDAAQPPSTRPTMAARRNMEKNCHSLPWIMQEIKRLETNISAFAREGPSQNDFRRQRFVTQCKSVILDLENNYRKNTKALVLDLFGQVNSLLLQYRDVVDPFNSCIICSEAVRTSAFPERVTANCQHTVSSCRDCLRNWVAASLSERGFAQLKCMECSTALNGDDIRAIASEETFQRYVLSYPFRYSKLSLSQVTGLIG